jgi:Xaa-Pro aminopeptidase
MRLATPDRHAERQSRLREQLGAAGLEALVVSSAANVAYLTGLFASTSALVVDQQQLRLIVDGRYAEAAMERAAQIPGLSAIVISSDGSIDEALVAEFVMAGYGRAGFDQDSLTVRRHQDLVVRLAAAGSRATLDPAAGIVERLRAVKDDWELATLRDAASRLSDAAKCIIPKALAGMSEREMAWRIEAELHRVGFDKPAFDTIVAAGPNSAMPHHRAGSRALEAGDLVVLDFGGLLDGYAVDLTRTITVGLPGIRERHLLERVAEAQMAAFKAVAVGRPATVVDDAARGSLVRDGLGEAFSHGTGHGLGLEVHERPRVGRRRTGQEDELLAIGMVFTIEPGAYLAGWGGARIEDDVVVTANGAEWLTDLPRLMWATE